MVRRLQALLGVMSERIGAAMAACASHIQQGTAVDRGPCAWASIVLGTRKRLLPQSPECRCQCQAVAEFVRVWSCLLCAARPTGSKDPTAVRDLLLSLLACCGIIVTKDELQLLHRTGTFHTLKVWPTQVSRKASMRRFLL
jgi:hypothetical protein